MAVQELQDDTFAQLAKNEEKIIVKFHANWCGSCKLFAPKFKRLSEDEQYNGIYFVKINAEENPQARQWAKVDNLPFFATVKNTSIQNALSTNKEDKVVEFLNELKK